MGDRGERDELQVAEIVEAYLEAVQGGGSLDPEPFIERAEALRAKLAPLLVCVLRLESLADSIKTTRGRSSGDPS